MNGHRRFLLVALLCASAGCDPGSKPAPEGPKPEADQAPAGEGRSEKPQTEEAKPEAEAAPVGNSIGVATMEEDGTLVLTLRATGPGGAVGDGQTSYAKDDPKYQEVLNHLGGLEPGQEKPVPPFPPPKGTWVYAVSKAGVRLGTIEVQPGTVGLLDAGDGKGEDLDRLEEQWKQVQTDRSFSLKVHKGGGKGERGALSAEVYKVDDPGYGEAVHWFLLDKGYGVTVVAEGESKKQAN